MASALAIGSLHAYHAWATRYAIAALNPVGEDLARFRAYVRDDYETVGWCLALVGVQAAIIVYARKVKTQAPAA